MKKLLIIAADPQDLVKYAGGTAARYNAEGNEVHAVYVHTADRGTAEKVSAILHLASWTCLDLTVPLRTCSENAGRLASLYRSVRPDIILTYSKAEVSPAKSRIRDYAMAAYQTASGAGYRDEQNVSPRQTPFFGFCTGEETPDLYLKIDPGISLKLKAAEAAGLVGENLKMTAVLRGCQSSQRRSTPCTFAEAFTSFGAIAKTGKFIW